MNKIVEISKRVHELSLECNPQRGYYASVERHINEHDDKFAGCGYGPEVLAECIRRDEFYYLQIYPTTPVGFVEFVHYDVEQLIDKAWARVEAGMP